MFLLKIQRDFCHPKRFGTFEKRASGLYDNEGLDLTNPETQKLEPQKCENLAGIRFDLQNQERFVIRTPLHLVVDKRKQRNKQITTTIFNKIV